jgi:Concanavalin A-like lectin/glucanases superfamily
VVKGNADSQERVFERAPAIFLYERTGQIVVYYTSKDTDTYPEVGSHLLFLIWQQGVSLISNARLDSGNWYHVAFVRMERKIKLYVNGILDAADATDDTSVSNDYSLYIGGKESYEDDCGLTWLVDNFQFFDRELESTEIQAEAYPSLGGVEAPYVQLGCIDCSLEEASEVCDDDYHICTKMELYGGAYMVARILGWVSYETYVFTYQDVLEGSSPDLDDDLTNYSIGMCCAD